MAHAPTSVDFFRDNAVANELEVPIMLRGADLGYLPHSLGTFITSPDIIFTPRCFYCPVEPRRGTTVQALFDETHQV